MGQVYEVSQSWVAGNAHFGTGTYSHTDGATFFRSPNSFSFFPIKNTLLSLRTHFGKGSTHCHSHPQTVFGHKGLSDVALKRLVLQPLAQLHPWLTLLLTHITVTSESGQARVGTE